MSDEFHVSTCAFCRKSWKRTSISAQSDNPLHAALMFGQGATQGFVCEKCDIFICELCFLKSNRQCFFCGNQHCSNVWVESLTKSEQEMHRAFQKYILFYGLLGIVWVIGMGIVSPLVFLNITLEKSIGITLLTVSPMFVLFRHMRGLSPFDKKGAILAGRLFGGIAGIGAGTILGWGGVLSGGAFDLGLVPWIIGWTVLLSIGMGYSLSTPARTLTDGTSS